MTLFRRVLLASLGATFLTFSACSPSATAECGNGKIEGHEQCDDGNLTDGDGCQNNCTSTPGAGDGGTPVCGNERIEVGEACDDGNQINGDGCENDCRQTSGEPSCGNSLIEAGETCDDGNQMPDDGCSEQCLLESFCGDTKVEGAEECDDGNQTPGDGCEPVTCTKTPGCGNAKLEGTEACDDGNQTPGDGCENDCTETVLCGNGVVDPLEECDDSNRTNGDGCEANCTTTASAEISCGTLPPVTSGNSCDVTAGNGAKLIEGVVLAPGKVYTAGQVLVTSSGQIACVGCGCDQQAAAAGATRITCPDTVISPGLINSHDHTTYFGSPYTATDERYEHRHDWRKGNDGHTVVPSGPNDNNGGDNVRWNELRQLVAGTTSVNGSGGASGFLRNLDKANSQQQGLGEGADGVHYNTFPLGDSSSGTERVSGCGYGSNVDDASVIPTDSAYTPHVAEGIETSARNEFLCLSGIQAGGASVLGTRTAIIHGIGLTASDIGRISAEGTSLIWSPRSNVTLYGDTARVNTYKALNVNIALGTDWLPSGSMNMLRELKCADYLNANLFGESFSDEQLWRMVTANAADALATESIGRLAAGKVADIAVFKLSAAFASNPHRAVIAANNEDVVMTLRGGKFLFGESNIASAIGTNCETVDVCTHSRSVCIQDEATKTFAALASANASRYPLFACGGTPQNEPTCVPQRTRTTAPLASQSGSNLYTGAPAAGDADADGIVDAADNCPGVFNPIRPMDNGVQPDFDADGVGDACDVCPMNTGTTCTPPNPQDRDGDTVLNSVDNCADVPNLLQEDDDADGQGNACDACPTVANPGGSACPVTIYDVKTGVAAEGNKIQIPEAIVTGVYASGLFIQMDPSSAGYTGADHSGIYLHKSGLTGVNLGDRVKITDATVSLYFGQIQLTQPSILVLTSGNPLPAPVQVTSAEVMTGGSRAQALEGVLVKVGGPGNPVIVTNVAPTLGGGDKAPSNEFVIDDGVRVNDLLFAVPQPTLGSSYESITGVLDFRNDNMKIEPRSALDLVEGAPTLIEFGPAVSYVREGTTGASFPQALTVRLSRAVTMDTVVTISSGNPLLADVANVTIAANESAAVVPVEGVLAGPLDVTLTATYDGVSKDAVVRVLGATEGGTLSSISPTTGSVNAGGMVTLTVTLDKPAAPGGTSIDLAASPTTGFGIVPVNVIVNENQLSADFTFTAEAMPSVMQGTVTATHGLSTQTATLDITQSVSGLVINEVDYDMPGAGDSMEYVELYNSSSSTVDLTNLTLFLVNKTGLAVYKEIPLFTAGQAFSTLAPGEYLVVTNSTGLTLPMGTKVVAIPGGGTTDQIQNGDSDGVLLADVASGTVLDSLSYEGVMGAGNIPGVGSVSCTEGGSAAPTDSGAGSIGRSSTSTDTDVNGTDFTLSTTSTPGAVNP